MKLNIDPDNKIHQEWGICKSANMGDKKATSKGKQKTGYQFLLVLDNLGVNHFPPPKKKNMYSFQICFLSPTSPPHVTAKFPFFSGSVNNSEFGICPSNPRVASPSSGVSRVPYHDHFPPPARRNPHLTLQWTKATILNVTTNHTLPKDGHGFWMFLGDGWMVLPKRAIFGLFSPQTKTCPCLSLSFRPEAFHFYRHFTVLQQGKNGTTFKRQEGPITKPAADGIAFRKLSQMQSTLEHI